MPVYIDGLSPQSLKQHLEHIQVVLESLIAADLKLKPKIGYFLWQDVKYLGHVITTSGLQLNREQVSAVLDFPVHNTVTQVWQFLGLASFYHRIYQLLCTKIASPLHNLLKGEVEFVWTEECQVAFNNLKHNTGSRLPQL